MKIIFNDKKPIFRQIVDYIKAEVISGSLLPGSKLPSVRDMAVDIDVNPNTIHRVYQLLESEGIAYTERGLGTFISRDDSLISRLREEMANKIVIEYYEEMQKIGINQSEMIDYLKNYMDKDHPNG